MAANQPKPTERVFLFRLCTNRHQWKVANENERYLCPECGAWCGHQFETEKDRQDFLDGKYPNNSWWTKGT